MATTKSTIYYLNGKKVDKSTITKRKNKKLCDIEIITEKYYEAPLTESEKDERQKTAINASKYFTELREMREEQEKYHG